MGGCDWRNCNHCKLSAILVSMKQPSIVTINSHLGNPTEVLLQVRALLMLSWLSLGQADEIVGAGVQGPVVQGGTWALGTFLGGILGVAGSLGRSHNSHVQVDSSTSAFHSETNGRPDTQHGKCGGRRR